jgi:Flp pilus assembly protein CpaB
VRVAVDGPAGVRRSWRVSSQTPIAEVQLAQPMGDQLVLVLRVYTDTQDEFVAFVLNGHGIAKQLSLGSADWAETAPLSRFRLVGSSLYKLGSTPTGMFVDRFDLGVGR